MDTFRENGATTTKLRKFNRCQLYFRVARLSDITNIAGTHLYAHVLVTLERDQAPLSHPTYPKSQLQWPRQPRPGIIARKIWMKHSKAAFLEPDHRLGSPLGRWTIPVDQRDRLYRYRYPKLYHAASYTLLQVFHQDDGKVYRQLRPHPKSVLHSSCSSHTFVTQGR
jgi:hypothetical protein